MVSSRIWLWPIDACRTSALGADSRENEPCKYVVRLILRFFRPQLTSYVLSMPLDRCQSDGPQLCDFLIRQPVANHRADCNLDWCQLHMISGYPRQKWRGDVLGCI